MGFTIPDEFITLHDRPAYGIGHWYLGVVNFRLLESRLVGSIPGILIGSFGARYTSDVWLKPALSLVLILVGIKMLT